MELGLEELVGGVAPPDLSGRIERAVRDRLAEKTAPRPPRLAAAILIAASLLVGALVLWKILATSPSKPVPAKEQKSEPPPSPPQEPDALQRLSDVLEREAREGDPDPALRAEAFLKVQGSPEEVSRALFKAAVCFRLQGGELWAKKPQNLDAKAALDRAEQTLVKVLARQGDPARSPLLLLAEFERAALLMHEANDKPADALQVLDQIAKGVPPEDPWIARVWATQIQCNAQLNRLDAAVAIHDRLMERHPESRWVVRASKTVAIKLDEATEALIRTNGDPALIERNLRKISKCYVTWINLGPVHGAKITPADLLAVAETLYSNAKRLNHLDIDLTSFSDLRGRKIEEPQYFADAAIAHSMLADVNTLPERDRLVVGVRRARCLAFAARDANGWRAARDAYRDFLTPLKLVQKSGVLDPAVLAGNPMLLGVYTDLGHVQLELARSAAGERASFDEASIVFSNILRMVQPGTEPWWVGKYMVLEVLLERGSESDVKLSKVGLENLERNNPDFDAGQFGMKDRFLKLKQKIADAMNK